ncbi:M23 family metallopeptidase [Leptolyngbya sp. BL0902]|uniref:M23 family metallopeptidase n=1 Tax=Leptolyngbya sp. BL0902 TaxID=1115757 RepID=UPI0018E71535|nr:M23 family metallopeptidase [Leptolyngbya sp. BL0902]
MPVRLAPLGRWGVGVIAGLSVGLWGSPGPAAELSWIAQASSSADSLCPAPALSRLGRHRVAAGETLETIAQRYGLLSTTIMGFNPAVQGGRVSVGQELVIPPYNGIRVRVSPGQTWAQVAQAYDRQADLLFEINGCVGTVPTEIFIPGINWFPGVSTAASTNNAPQSRPSPLQGYPLPERAEVVMNFGWQPAPDRDEVVFNTGVALAATAETPVLAVGSGTVAFVGTDPVYGNLIVVNHADGLQTRYANLTAMTVAVGQTVAQGARLGQVAPQDERPESYLFFEVRLNSALGWVAQNPHDLVPAMALR